MPNHIDQPPPNILQYFSTSSSQHLKTFLPFVSAELSSVSLPYCNSLELTLSGSLFFERVFVVVVVVLSIYLFIYLWLHWVFVAVRRLSLVAASWGYSSLQCAGFSLWWLLFLRSTGSRCSGFSSCGMGSRAQAQ